MRAVAPLWLARPSRFAALDRRTARVVAVLATLLVLLSATALIPAPAAIDDPAAIAIDRDGEILRYDTIVEQVRHGGDYYAAAAPERGDAAYATAPLRLPTLSMVQAWLPAAATPALFYALVALVAASWYARWREALPRRGPRLFALALLLAGVVPLIDGGMTTLHESWAGLLIAASLAVRRPGQATASIALALSAMLIRETAAIYAGVMLLGALLGGRRREAAGWVVALAIFAVVAAAHASAVAAMDASAASMGMAWGLPGYGAFVRAAIDATALSTLPAVVAAPLVSLALIGWAGWRSPLALRVFATLVTYALWLSLATRPGAGYEAAMAAPLLLSGLVFLPDAVRDLARAASSARRRITVTRAAR